MEIATPPVKVCCPCCSNETIGPYCHHCGEKIAKGKQHLYLKNFLRDAFRELTDVDSKFLTTFKYLLLRPGFLTREALAGRTNLYIKPLRLYVTLVVFHFLVFSNFKSGDIFQVDRFPMFSVSVQLRTIIAEHEAESNLTHEQFNELLSQKMKDNLGVLIYFVVFMAAYGLYLLNGKFSKLYVEHLYFAFHIFSFSLLRNLFLIPVVILDIIPFGVFLVISSQILYTFFAMKNVYPESTFAVLLKTFAFLIILVIMFFMAITACLFIGFSQIG